MSDTRNTEFTNEDPGFPVTDLTLIIEGQELHVNKALLIEHSPVFKAMFTSEFKEKYETKVELKDKSVTGFREFLRCFYPNMQHPITRTNVLKILPIAHEYQSPLKDACEKFMKNRCIKQYNNGRRGFFGFGRQSKTLEVNNDITIQELLEYIVAAEKYDLDSLLSVGIKLAAYVDFGKITGKERLPKYGFGDVVEPHVHHHLFEDEENIIEMTEDFEIQKHEDIACLFNMLTLKTRFAISENRLTRLEWKLKKDEASVYNTFIKLQ